MTRRTFAALAGFLPLRSAAENKIDRGKRTIDEVIAALGGENLLRMRDRVESGRVYSFYREDLTGLSRAKIYTQYIDNPQPGKLGVLERQAFGKKEESAVLFIDGEGYDVTFRGARPLPDSLIERYHDSTRHNFFYILRMRIKEPGLTFEFRGNDVVENQSVDIIDVIDAQNEVVTVYVNTHTKLPLRQRFYRRDPLTQDRIEEVTRFSKYKDAGKGVKWPLDLQRERDTEKLTEIYDEAVRIDTGLRPELFQLPSGVKLLKKEKS
ncbi:MAG: hypothetical protein JWO80_303 [Bryobacterales bacterium]|nr:hypothetical protein [Bryobacterales bacterium]